MSAGRPKNYRITKFHGTKLVGGQKKEMSPKNWVGNANLSVEKINPYMRPSLYQYSQYEAGGLRHEKLLRERLKTIKLYSKNYELGLTTSILKSMTLTKIRKMCIEKIFKLKSNICFLCKNTIEDQTDGVFRRFKIYHHLCAARVDDRDRQVRVLFSIHNNPRQELL